jgi:hypothetical protein
MVVIPFQINERQYSVFVGFDEQGIQRMREYDPAELVLQKLPDRFQRLQLKDVLFGYCDDDDMSKIQVMLSEDGTPGRALRYLSRGWKFRQDFGDHDGPMLSALPDPNETKH